MTTTRFLILVVLRLPTFGSNFATLGMLYKQPPSLTHSNSFLDVLQREESDVWLSPDCLRNEEYDIK